MAKALGGKTTSQKRAKPRAAITAVHGYLPPDVLTNAELAEMVDTSDAWIQEGRGADSSQ